MKNEFSYYITMPLITRPVVINPDHLLLYGLQTHTDQESISHITYSTHSLFFFFFLFHFSFCIFLNLSALHFGLLDVFNFSLCIFIYHSLRFFFSFPFIPLASFSTEPNFVSSYDIGNFTYFFFRENAVEHDCGRTVFSRAGRVCKNDIGGRFLLEDTWTTFMKARLNCSRPGEIPFNYNELQGTFYLPELELLYGIFTTNV